MLDEWDSRSRPHVARSATQKPGVYALYQRGKLKYIGQSRDCDDRIRHHRTKRENSGGLWWLEDKPAWEKGVEFTARILPLPGLTDGRGSADERMRRRWERYFIYWLRPPCNTIRRTVPPKPF